MKKLRLDDFDAIAFDVEGTLADTLPVHHAARVEAFKRHGYGHISREQHELGSTYGSSTPDIIGGILHAAGEIQKDGPFKHNAAIQEVCATRTQLFGAMAEKGFDEMPEAADFVRLVATLFAGRMALVTSSPKRFVLPFLGRYDIAKHFPESHIISDDTVAAHGLEGKPAPDPYRLAMKKLQARNLLVFEDTVPGVASAKAAGATVIALGFEPSNTKLFHSGRLAHSPDALVNNYAQAKELLGLVTGTD